MGQLVEPSDRMPRQYARLRGRCQRSLRGHVPHSGRSCAVRRVRSAKRVAAAVKHVPGSMASEKRKDVCEQSKQWTERRHHGQHAACRKRHRPYEIVEQASGRKLAYPQNEKCRKEAEHGQQRKHGAENAGESPHDLYSSQNRCRHLRWTRMHVPTMRRRLAARLLGRFRFCVFSCRFRADAGVVSPPRNREPRSRPARGAALRGLMPVIAWQARSTLP